LSRQLSFETYFVSTRSELQPVQVDLQSTLYHRLLRERCTVGSGRRLRRESRRVSDSTNAAIGRVPMARLAKTLGGSQGAASEGRAGDKKSGSHFVSLRVEEETERVDNANSEALKRKRLDSQNSAKQRLVTTCYTCIGVFVGEDREPRRRPWSWCRTN